MKNDTTSGGQLKCVRKQSLGLGPDDLATAVRELERQAIDAWADLGRRQRWTFFLRLSWSWDVDELRATEQLRSWAEKLCDRGYVTLVGQHPSSPTHRRHAHALVYVPRSCPTPSCQPDSQCWA